MRTPIIALLTAIAVSGPAALADAETLTITVTGVRSEKGAVRAAVYDSEASFLIIEKARASGSAKAAAGEVKIVVDNLPDGRYAVTTFHDENGNGKLDRDSLNIPTEGYGFSNDARGRFGPPKFGAAAFQLGPQNQAISLALDY